MPNESRICSRVLILKKENLKSVAGQFAAVKQDYGVDKYWVLLAVLAVLKESSRLENNKHCCVHLTNLVS
jgi:hypothetical protein